VNANVLYHSLSQRDKSSKFYLILYSLSEPSMVQGRIIEWIPMYPDVVVWVSVARLDASWHHHVSYYVGPHATGPGNAMPSRYKRFGEWLAEGRQVWMPHIGLSGRHVSFSDGRHRFAWLRDNGVKALPVTVSPQIAAEIQRRFGTKTRISRLPAQKN
jgi:hypothetical protein